MGLTLALELGATRAVFVPRLLHSLQLFWAVPPRLNLSSLEVVVANGWHRRGPACPARSPLPDPCVTEGSWYRKPHR